MVVNVVGYYLAGVLTASGAFVPVPGALIYSTVPNTPGVGRPGGAGPVLEARHTYGVEIEGAGGIQVNGVSAVAATLLAVKPAASGWFIVYPTSTPRPAAASVDFGRATAPLPATHAAGGLTVTGVGLDGLIELYNGSAGATDVDVNVTGYYLS